ncbi:hypothetical protein CR194_03200 [Salipaludibacillus keqinensis]|uniref:DUF1798 domain-containing protein n=1 Tax=Salipaludibacillus keqinensis TaxID=2045207 RepID=A0A323TKQ7_9BACI|nr:YppE family protein [Salipaludibacillus keqinensis]PYZ94554.1 hypothetical protein CR194_03200 [Salipaludibacillus keqinensis]
MNQEEWQLLKEKTSNLRQLNEKAYENYKEFSVGDKEADFFGHVKPFADDVKIQLEAWTPMVLKWLEYEKPSYLHPQQIDQLVENFEILSVTCFQKDTKNKKLMERYKSIEYTLSLVVQS